MISRVLNYVVTENITPNKSDFEGRWLCSGKTTKPQVPRQKKRRKDKINLLRKDLCHLGRWSKDEIHNEATQRQGGK